MGNLFLNSAILLLISTQAGSAEGYPCAEVALKTSLGYSSDLYEWTGVSPISDNSVEIELSITGVTERSLLPFARVTADGRRIVEVHKDFPVYVCRYVLANLLTIGASNHEDPDSLREKIWLPAQNNLKLCADDFSKSNTECLLLHSIDLERAANLYLDTLSLGAKLEVYNSTHSQTRDALAAVILHEIGHHAKAHFGRLENGDVNRSLAEFEADVYAVDALLANGVATTGYANFFIGLAQSEIVLGSGMENIYKSPFCRFTLSTYIDGNKGIVGAILLNWSLFGSTAHTQTTFDDLFSMLDDEEKAYQSSWPTKECGLPELEAMSAANREMRNLLEFLRANRSVLFSHRDGLNSIPPLPKGGKAAISELAELITQGGSFSAFKSRLTMVFLRRQMRSNGVETFAKNEILDLLRVIIENGVSEDARTAKLFLDGL